MALLNVHELGLSFGGTPLFEQVGLTVEPGERVCLIGRNGTGKSTLLSVLSGDAVPDSGTISTERQACVSYLPQETPLNLDGSARQVVMNRSKATGIAEDPETLEERRVRAEQNLTRLGVDPNAPTDTMSGGERRRVMLAAALTVPWDVLLLDEPTNHLDIETIEWLERSLVNATSVESRAVLFVSHDRAFSRNVATRVIALDRGRLLSFPGSYDRFVERWDDFLEAEERRNQEFDKKLAQEEAWLRRGVKARRTRNEGRVRALTEMRRRYEERRTRGGTARMRIAAAGRSGDLVIKADDLSFSWSDTEEVAAGSRLAAPASPIISGLSTTIEYGDRIGVVGPNGSGKTTLLRLLLGELHPNGGTVRHGQGLQIVYFDQLRRSLDPKRSLFDALGDGYDTVEVDGRRRHVLAYMQDFLFDADDRNRPVETLSGGERNRLLLARLFARRSNLLVLDEPTNDLDQETLELLESLLSGYRGTILLVSHDREFLDNVVAGCLVLTGNGVVEEHAGGYSQWRRRYRELNGEAPDRVAGDTEVGQSEVADGRTAKGSVSAKGQSTTAAEMSSAGTAEAMRRIRDRRLSYREKQELANIPDRIEALEQEREEINARLSDPSLYQQDDGRETMELTERLSALGSELDVAYERWEELTALEE